MISYDFVFVVLMELIIVQKKNESLIDEMFRYLLNGYVTQHDLYSILENHHWNDKYIGLG